MDRLGAAQRIVKTLIRNLDGRCGLGDEWDGLDDDVKTAITEDWVTIVYGVLTEYDAPYLGQN